MSLLFLHDDLRVRVHVFRAAVSAMISSFGLLELLTEEAEHWSTVAVRCSACPLCVDVACDCSLSVVGRHEL